MIPEIKICGITRKEELAYLEEARIDYAGFVFYKKSKRNVTFSQAESLLKNLHGTIKPVAVVVSPGEQQIAELLKLPFQVIQIHGSLPSELISELPVDVWQTVNITSLNALEETKLETVDGYVIDGASYGSGETFVWQNPSDSRVFQEMRRKKLILAGGLNQENVGMGMEIFTPDVVDVSSGVERDFGKDRTKILEFAKAVRKDG